MTGELSPSADPSQTRLAERARAISGTLDERMWALAGLALEARLDGIPEWANVIARVHGRAARTIREWACVAEYFAGLPLAERPRWAYIATAYKFREKLGQDDILGMLETALAENASADQYAAELRDMLPDTVTDYPARWQKQSIELFGLVDSYADPVRTLLRNAALALSEAATGAKK